MDCGHCIDAYALLKANFSYNIEWLYTNAVAKESFITFTNKSIQSLGVCEAVHCTGLCIKLVQCRTESLNLNYASFINFVIHSHLDYQKSELI